ncbi:MAG: HD domain-containing protein, partial [Flavobacteriaceae bacterium]
DVDRLDYLKRDSFYTGVTEGNINTDRIVAMMNVENEELVFESKGVHSLEKFLLARRLMYWQVYLHKTSLVAELILVKVLSRFRTLVENGTEILTETHPLYPFYGMTKELILEKKALTEYLTIDDSDILFLLKSWMNHEDIVLKKLSSQLINRSLPKVKLQSIPFEASDVLKKKQRVDPVVYNDSVLDYFVFSGSVSNQTFVSDQAQILLKEKSGAVNSIAKAIDYLDFEQFSKPIHKYYLCYPKSK